MFSCILYDHPFVESHQAALVYLGLKRAICFRHLLEIVHRSKIVPARRSVSKCLAVNTCVASRDVDDEHV